MEVPWPASVTQWGERRVARPTGGESPVRAAPLARYLLPTRIACGQCPALTDTLNVRLLIMPSTRNLRIGRYRSGPAQQSSLSVGSDLGKPPMQSIRTKFIKSDYRRVHFDRGSHPRSHRSPHLKGSCCHGPFLRLKTRIPNKYPYHLIRFRIVLESSAPKA